MNDDARQPKRRSLYHEIGGESVLRRLVESFYDIVEQDEEAAGLHLLHRQGHGVAHSRQEQFNYLSGFFGGPSYYVQFHGHARLREIHEHVPIGAEMRDIWLNCMRKAIDRSDIPEHLREKMMRHFTVAADTARNEF